MSAATASFRVVHAYMERHRDRYVDELCEYLRIPSISSLASHAADMLRCAEWTATALERAGLEHVAVIRGDGHPIVYGDWLHAPGAPVLLCYGHYDVQPADATDAWHSPPFEPTVRGRQLFARGATDDKGQLYIHVKAIEAYLAACGALPVNIRVVIEGEEECGGVALHRLVTRHPERLAADVIVNSDNAMFARGVPSISCAIRGIVSFEIEMHGARSDVHSGSFGGTIANPALELSRFLASLMDSSGRVTIPGFYDDVVPLTEAERVGVASLPFDDAVYAKGLGVPALSGEQGYSTLERMWARPTLDVHGLHAGWVQEGVKTIIPSRAVAKVSMRLVPNQQSERIANAIRSFVTETAPASMRVRLTEAYGGDPWHASPDSAAIRAAARAMECGFGKAPVFVREGGSNPIVTTMEQSLNASTVMLGIGLPDENAHGPNEHLDLDNFHRGIVTAACFYGELAASAGSPRKPSHAGH